MSWLYIVAGMVIGDLIGVTVTCICFLSGEEKEENHEI